MKTVDIAFKPHIDAVTVRPGDTLVIRVANATQDQAIQIIEHVTASLPGVNVEVVSADQILVYRPDGEL